MRKHLTQIFLYEENMKQATDVSINYPYPFPILLGAVVAGSISQEG